MKYKYEYDDQDFFSGLRDSLPPVFTRKFASEITGGLFSAKALSNMDSAGRGPSRKVMSGKTILYEKEDFIDWLKTTIKEKKKIERPLQHRSEPMYEECKFDISSIPLPCYPR